MYTLLNKFKHIWQLPHPILSITRSQHSTANWLGGWMLRAGGAREGDRWKERISCHANELSRLHTRPEERAYFDWIAAPGENHFYQV